MDANKLLDKSGWTGEETGKALIYSLVSEYRQILEGKSDPKPLFPIEKIKAMLHGLRASANDIEQYNRYLNLQNWIRQYQAVANAYFQRFQGCINDFIAVVKSAETAENENRYIEQLPRIMTQKQYDELRAARIAETLDPDRGGGEEYSLFCLIGMTINLYARRLENRPNEDNPLKELKASYQQMPVKDKALIAAYNQATDNGYYQIPDGTRSDQATPEEWAERLTSNSQDLQRLFAEAEAGLTGAYGSLEFERITRAARAAHMGEPKPEEKSIATWHTCGGASDGLTLWDLLEACATGEVEIEEYYPALGGSDELTPGEFASQVTAFNKEFPGLSEAMLKVLDGMGYTYGDDKKPLSTIPVGEWNTTVATLRQLYDTAYPGVREWVDADINIFDGDARALLNGIAILQPYSQFKTARIDGNGYYIEPDSGKSASALFGLEQYMPENPESGDAIDRLEHTRATLEKSLRWIIGFDTALDLIAQEIDIPDFKLFHVDSEKCIARAEAVNGLFDMLYIDIQGIKYQDKEKQALKLQTLRDIFYPIKTRELIIPDEKIKEAAKMLTRLDAFGENRGGNAPGWDFLTVLTEQEGGADE